MARVTHVESSGGLVCRGTVLELAASQWKYGDGPLRIRVERDRPDLSRYYEDKVWIEGWRLDETDTPVEWMQALVSVQALAEAGTAMDQTRSNEAR